MGVKGGDNIWGSSGLSTKGSSTLPTGEELSEVLNNAADIVEKSTKGTVVDAATYKGTQEQVKRARNLATSIDNSLK